jgi:SAM-dependent MidA family methyltransferase
MGELLEILRAKGRMNFATFMQTALYEPGLGYYAKPGRRRVGRDSGADFATAESLGGVFAALAVAGAASVAGKWVKKGALFVEMGAEPGGECAARHASPPFAGALAVGLGDDLPAGKPFVLFSNELFDAQPFYRLVRLGGTWRECGVEIVGDKAVEVVLEKPCAQVEIFLSRLPADAPEGYRADLPLAAAALLAQLVLNEDVAAFVAFDYGLDWDDIVLRRPAGTARAYRAQQVAEDLLANPGEQDLTCHIAWDMMEEILRAAGFSSVRTESQESFFMHNAFAAMTKILSKADPVECGKLRELIHPMRMGSAFQVLSAVR